MSSAANPHPPPPATWQLVRWRVRTQVFVERLDGLELPMVRIPTGSFWMGSPEGEEGRSETEGPRQEVRLREFLLGQTPITQAQWREVAQWQEREGERWERELVVNPSRFQPNKETPEQGENWGSFRLWKGEISADQRPVERVSWDDAVEFCQRLSQRTGRHYTLPSEAQWEYACRAGTNTPFAFGATLSDALANYNATAPYANGPTGVWRQQTTPVGMFPANAWGLHDMHGNVWEWCLDEWHDSYQYDEALEDGRPWGQDRKGSKEASPKKEKKKIGDSKNKLLRGGSWLFLPGGCRSASRLHVRPIGSDGDVGFRVACLPPG